MMEFADCRAAPATIGRQPNAAQRLTHPLIGGLNAQGNKRIR
jgi:hypothetical protein